MPAFNFPLPSFYDRADGGLTNVNGTPTITNLSKGGGIGSNYGGTSGYPTMFEEDSDSPIIEFGEQCTITHTFTVDYYTGMILQQQYQRGAYMSDSGLIQANQNNIPGNPRYGNAAGTPNITRVLSTRMQPIDRTNTQACKLIVVSEGTSFGAPPEEFSITTQELNPVAEKHPRYSALDYYTRNIIRNADVADFIDVQNQWSAVLDSLEPFSNANPYPNPGNPWGAAQELLFKKQKGEDTFYLSGFKITYSQYFWAPQDINPGGFFQDPFSVIPSYYWTDTDGLNIFAQPPNGYNANMYPNTTPDLSEAPYGLSWLRQTDTLELNRTWWKFNMTWIGAPLGIWDNEWYNPTLQQLQTSSLAGGINVNFAT